MGYLGSKGQAGVWQRIIGQMPAHSFYGEPFYGSGQVFERKFPAAENVIIDADPDVIKKFTRIPAPFSTLKASVATRAICGDAISILPTLTLPDDAVIYCDPPYLLSTRTSRHRYKFEMTEEQHETLLTILQDLNCRVMISGYPSTLYSARLKAWRCISYRTRTRGRTLTECLWCNFPEPTELHDWRFAGRDFRERLKLKRQAARWLSRVDAMPPLQKGFLLHAIEQRHFTR